MPYQIAATASGPLAELSGSLALPRLLQLDSPAPHSLWALVDSARPDSQQNAWAILPGSAPAPRAFPRFESVDDWAPGLTALFERRLRLRAAAAAEVSALWTSIAAPISGAAIAGDIGLDLDLGIQARAHWNVDSDFWLSIRRPSAAPVLEVRLCAARIGARSIDVKATAHAGLDEATRKSLAAILARQRDAVIDKLGTTDKTKKFAPFLERWLSLGPVERERLWANPDAEIVLAAKQAVGRSLEAALRHTDEVTARLEYAAVRTLEKQLEVSLAVELDKRQATSALLDATFDFGANPALAGLFAEVREGNLTPLVEREVPGLTLRACTLAEEHARRRTFRWRVPFASGFAESRDRLFMALEALDDETGRIVHARATAESARATRHCASLLTIEAALAARLSGDVTVHDASALHARFELDLRTTRPRSLAPLLQLYGQPLPADPHVTRFRLAVSMPPESLAHWLEPQDPAALSRRLQQAWRALLPAAVDLNSLNEATAAPLFVWASLPVSTAARLTANGVQLDCPGDLYWDWANKDLVRAMVWNPRTRAALEARIAQSPFRVTADEMRRTLERPVGAAVFQSLLCVEASLADNLPHQLGLRVASPRGPVETLRNVGHLLESVTGQFHRRLTSVYGADAARALGPLLLTAASPVKPEVEAVWYR